MKLIIFDMDGVLVDACEWHRVALNDALLRFTRYQIPLEDHYAEYNGIPTRVKLAKLVEKGHVRQHEVSDIEAEKQRRTLEIIESSAGAREEKIELMRYLKKQEVLIACYTNSIRETAELMLKKTGVLQHLDLLITNQDVLKPKPDPEGYLKCMKDLNVTPDFCLIVEDSPKGIQAATLSGAKVLVVQSPEDVTIDSIARYLT